MNIYIIPLYCKRPICRRVKISLSLCYVTQRLISLLVKSLAIFVALYDNGNTLKKNLFPHSLCACNSKIINDIFLILIS